MRQKQKPRLPTTQLPTTTIILQTLSGSAMAVEQSSVCNFLQARACWTCVPEAELQQFLRRRLLDQAALSPASTSQRTCSALHARRQNNAASTTSLFEPAT